MHGKMRESDTSSFSFVYMHYITEKKEAFISSPEEDTYLACIGIAR